MLSKHITLSGGRTLRVARGDRITPTLSTARPTPEGFWTASASALNVAMSIDWSMPKALCSCCFDKPASQGSFLVQKCAASRALVAAHSLIRECNSDQSSRCHISRSPFSLHSEQLWEIGNGAFHILDRSHFFQSLTPNTPIPGQMIDTGASIKQESGLFSHYLAPNCLYANT